MAPAVLEDFRPIWRGRLHAWAFLAAIPAGLFLLMRADGATPIVATSIYVVSVLALFGTSATYHSFPHSPRAKAIMQRLDHSMIFVLIAGTYTPLCLVALPPAWGIPVLCVVWAGAAAGMTLKLVAFDRWRVLSHSLYPILGWTAVIVMPVLVTRLTAAQIALVVAGGLIYTMGIPVLVRRRPDPWPSIFGYHEVWHGFTIVAGACHFAAIALLIG